jgi:hypothetical protein
MPPPLIRFRDVELDDDGASGGERTDLEPASGHRPAPAGVVKG